MITDFQVKIDVVTLFVDHLSQTKEFYQKVFGLPVHYEDDDSVVFAFAGTLVNLLDRSAARELLEPVEPGSASDGPRLVMTLTVADVDAAVEHLVSRGATLLNGPMDRPWGKRTASFQDPAGHVWEIAD
jgi:catechol 2,3-dioxygenase-like lactoylglutathione lyase family enzyme